jgi:hypothetical protein
MSGFSDSHATRERMREAMLLRERDQLRAAGYSAEQVGLALGALRREFAGILTEEAPTLAEYDEELDRAVARMRAHLTQDSPT